MAPLLAAAALLGCPATTVHYTATSYGTPWVATRAMTGHLFALAAQVALNFCPDGSTLSVSLRQ